MAVTLDVALTLTEEMLGRVVEAMGEFHARGEV